VANCTLEVIKHRHFKNFLFNNNMLIILAFNKKECMLVVYLLNLQL